MVFLNSYERELEVATRAVEAAGDSLLEWERPPVEEWKGRIDPVSEADRTAERRAVRVLEGAFDDVLVTEETESLTEPEVAGRRRWYLDPLDGTVNFLREFDRWCTSLALVDERNKSVCAAVYAPAQGDLYRAVEGGGATLNGEAIQVSDCDRLKRALVASGFPYEFEDPDRTNLSEWSNVTPNMMAMRCLGTAALDLCEVARGRLDAFWEMGLGRWDIAAGAMIAREAGARVTGVEGDPMPGASTHVLAAAPGIHESIQQLLREA